MVAAWLKLPFGKFEPSLLNWGEAPDRIGDAVEDQQRLQARRAIEALRAGVPNHEAVKALGITAPAIEDRFVELLSQIQQAGAEPVNPAGFLVAGEFGSGKSHLLEYCRRL